MAYKMPSRPFFSTAFLSTFSSLQLRSAASISHSSGASRLCTKHISPRSLSFPTLSPFSCSRRAALSSYTKPPAAMEVELTAPNGKKWSQPLGLLINGEFVKSSNEQKITSINPS